ncbi:hypothetical protein KY312_04835 [Candidatus Woesearchaeota archaeon]|nr:hypothetical protein [Candidatus Woesearchaeota archaeon]
MSKEKKKSKNKLKQIDFKDFLEIDEISDDVVILKNGAMLAVLRIKPVNFERMNEKNQQKIISAYRHWIESLTYPVQIVARTVNTDVNETMNIFRSTTEKHIKESSKDFKESLSKFRNFSSWLNIYSCKTRPRRLFYVVIPYSPVYEDNKDLKKRKNFKKSLRKLNKRVFDSKKLLEATGVKTRRLSDKQLENFYDSYFKMHFVFMQDKMPYYFKSDEWLKKWKTESMEE